MNVRDLQIRLREFARARDWEQFHSPKNLAAALAVEAAELLEPFQWMKEEESRRLAEFPHDYQRVREEIADVQIYLLRLADQLQIDLAEAVEQKLVRNAEKYPVDLSRGTSLKYDRLAQRSSSDSEA
ncbi:MAG: nucleotide pyrophosphohydrolase [Methylococcaceae bacterium]|nr:nucleotide pyrophosphohydrolase [Methylococcaceae bacterium]